MNDSDAIATVWRLVPRSRLCAAELTRMHDLLSSHFEGISFDTFVGDLSEKNWVILVERDARIVGFTTILAYETQFDGSPLSVIYSGDTIVSREAWNTSALPRAWIESVVALRKHYPRGRFFWLLITSGFRTYRFLPVFWREFFPRCDRPTPPEWKRLMDHIAGERFGSRYDREKQIVILPNPQQLRDDLAAIPIGREHDPHIAFFAETNPGYARGDELVCMTELTPSNLTAAGRRMAATVLQHSW